jgi:hypothetical protein
MVKSSNDQIATAANAAEHIKEEAQALLEPERPVQMSDAAQLNGKSGFSSSRATENGSSAAPLALADRGGASQLPGSEPHLQELLRESPFLDLSSPMTPYEWLKFFVMVRQEVSNGSSSMSSTSQVHQVLHG